MWPPFLNFRSGSASKIKKNWPKKGHKSRVNVFTRCACTRVCSGSQTILHSLGDQTIHMLNVWWSFDFICPRKCDGQIWTKCDGQNVTDKWTIKWTNGQTDKWTNGQMDKRTINQLPNLYKDTFYIIMYIFSSYM